MRSGGGWLRLAEAMSAVMALKPPSSPSPRACGWASRRWRLSRTGRGAACFADGMDRDQVGLDRSVLRRLEVSSTHMPDGAQPLRFGRRELAGVWKRSEGVCGSEVRPWAGGDGEIDGGIGIFLTKPRSMFFAYHNRYLPRFSSCDLKINKRGEVETHDIWH